MLRSIRISRAFWNSTYAVIIWALVAGGSGCVNRAPYIRMLDSRAGYGDAPDDEEVALYQRGRHAQDTVLQRSAPRVTKVYIFPHELPSRDYFWGGYVSLLVTQDRWVFEENEDEAPPTAGIRETKARHPNKHKKAANAPNATKENP